ncbi:MAG TPA: hypothetical protein VGF02_03740 [Pseudolabrys sp.]|jgi:hypothetical protein
MKRPHIAALLVLIVAIPAAAGSLFSSNTSPCFNAAASSYRISDNAAANFTVRIDNTAAKPDLRLQLIDDPAAADFVLVDDSDTVGACTDTNAVSTIRLDPQAANADLTVALSRAPAAYKIYVRSAGFSEQDAAALFAVIWNSGRKDARLSGSGREFAARN